MIVNWILYSVLASALLLLAGLAAEYAARSLRLPSRWVWPVVLSLSVASSTSALVAGMSAAPRDAAGSSMTRDGLRPNGVVAAAPGETLLAASDPGLQAGAWTQRALGIAGWRARIGIDQQATRHLDRPLLLASAMLTLLAFCTIGFACARIGGIAAGLDRAVVLDTPVLVSRDIGPALLGVFRYRVVLPRWVTELPAGDVRTILAHEQQHAAAGDPALILLGWLLVALQPWNVVLWVACSRLRLAVESDCDARVLGSYRASHPDVRAYGHLLITVYQRAERYVLPVTALVARRSELETRVRRMLERPRRAWSPVTGGAVIGALLLATSAMSLEVIAQRPAAAPHRPDVRPGRVSVRTVPAIRQSDEDSLTFLVDGRRASRAEASRVPLEEIAHLDPRVVGELVEVRISTTAMASPRTRSDSLAMRADSITTYVSHYAMRWYARRFMPAARQRGDDGFVWRVDTLPARRRSP